MSAVIPRDEVEHTGSAVAVSQTVALLQMLERAARDPNVDMDKMERLLALQERMIARQAEADFNDAMTACQKEMGTIGADKMNPQTKSNYATYAKLDKILRPIYTRHGISISYSTEDSPKEEHVRVLAYVSRGGYTRRYQADMPADGKGAKGGDVMTKTHATGAAIAYGSRYLLKAIFNVAVGEEDADGNAATSGITESEKDQLLAAVELVSDKATWEALWKQMVEATPRDAAARDEFRAVMAQKRKEVV